MTGLGPFDHPILSGLMGDASMAHIWSADRNLTHMRAFEAAWSRALGATGLAEPHTAETAAVAIERAKIDMGDLRLGSAQDGLAVPRLIKQLKAVAGQNAVHTGSTSQDVIDTALALTLKDTSGLIAERLVALITALVSLEQRFGPAPLMGRTRMQAATMITVTDRVLTWRLPLKNHATHLSDLRPRVERVQIGGASGDRAGLGDGAIVAHMAGALGLHPTDKAWHAMRENIVAYASHLSLITGTLGKVGQDLALMAQQGVDDVAFSNGGGSSAMPHKRNPILAELLVTLARFNAVQVGGMHQAMIHEQERSGAAWALEWMILPQMALATGRALTGAIALCDSITRLGQAPD